MGIITDFLIGNANQQYQKQYDQQAAADLAGGAGQYVQRQGEAVEKQAQANAKTSADLATKQAVKGAKTAGMMTGQAALAAARQAGDAYGASLANERGALRDQYTGAVQMTAGQGKEMSGRNLTRREQDIDLAGKIIGGTTSALGTLATKIPSDERVKEDARPAKMGDSLAKIRAYTYRYKGSSEPQIGVMAQDLEKGEMAPAVSEQGGVKMVDTRKLTMANTGSLAEHEKRLRSIEAIVRAVESRGKK